MMFFRRDGCEGPSALSGFKSFSGRTTGLFLDVGTQPLNPMCEFCADTCRFAKGVGS